MKMKSTIKNSITKKIMYSYISLLLIPVILFVGFVALFCNQYIIKTFLKEQQIMGDRYANELSTIMTKFNKTIDNMKEKKIFYLDYAKDIPVVFIDIQTYLTDAQTTLNYIPTLYYYDLYHNKSYSSLGMYNKMPFLEEIIERCPYIQTGTWTTYDNKINYIVPLEYSKNNVLRSAVIFSIDKSYFHSIANYASIYQETISIFSYDHKQIFRSSDNDLNNLGSSKYYHITSNSIKNSSFKIDHYIPKKVLFKNLYHITLISFSIIMLIIFAGSAIFYYMMKKNYNPLEKIMQRLFSEVYLNISDKYDIDSLNNATTEILTHKQELISNNRTLSKENFLFKLIHRQEKSEIISSCQQMSQICLPGPYYICISIDSRQQSELHIPSTVAFEKVTLDEHSSCIILSAGKHVLDDALHSFVCAHTTTNSQSIYIGIGTIVNDLAMLHESFLHSKIAKTQALREQTTIVWFDSASSTTNDTHYPYALIESLSGSCSCADIEKIMLLTDLLKDCVLKAPNRFLAICIYHDYLKTVSHAIEYLHIQGFDEVKLRNDYYTKTPASKEDMLDNMSSIFLYVNKYIAYNNEKVKQSLSIEAIKSYIDSNYLSQNFSFKNVADYFKTSQSNLSHFFKKEMQMTLSEYVDMLRIMYAKNSLASPGSNINAISQTLGFANASTFIRKFKKVEGMTPGEYKLHINS